MTEVLHPQLLRPGTFRSSTPPPRLESLAGAWLAGYRSQATRSAYRQDIRAWFAFCEAHGLDPLEVRRSHVELFARRLEHEGRSIATVARRLTGVACWYTWLVDEGYLTANPTARVHRPKPSTESTRAWLGRLELADWLNSAEAIGGYDYGLACLLAINALRVGEACRADISDLSNDRHHRTLQIVGKGAKPAVKPLTPRSAHAVDAAIEDRQDGPLLLSRGQTRMTREVAGRAVRRIARRAGISKALTPHSLRHSAITAALNAGVDLRDVQQYARHADPATIIRYDRARLTLDRHPAYVVDIHIASGSG